MAVQFGDTLIVSVADGCHTRLGSGGIIDLKKTVLATAMLLVLPSSAFCNYFDGNDLYAACESQKKDVIIYGMALVDAFELVDDKRVCIRPGVTGVQIGDVICNYLRDNPAPRNERAASQTLAALSRAWPPCN